MNINSMVITLCPLYAAPASAQHLFPLVLSPPLHQNGSPQEQGLCLLGACQVPEQCLVHNRHLKNGGCVIGIAQNLSQNFHI